MDEAPSSFINYASGFEWVGSTGFCGQLWHRGAELFIEPGRVLCARPGDVVSLRRTLVPGGLLVASVEPGVLERAAPGRAEQLWAPWVESPRLQRCLLELRAVLDPGVELVAAEQALRQLLAPLVDAFSLERPDRAKSDRRGIAARRVHERLHSDAGQRTDLATLAELVGMSRFQALRAFKRHYGLPPQAYHLRVRLSLAQRALREGVPPARVAAEFGFTDQSHLTRHFKRALGVTPARYARSSVAAPGRG